MITLQNYTKILNDVQTFFLKFFNINCKKMQEISPLRSASVEMTCGGLSFRAERNEVEKSHTNNSAAIPSAKSMPLSVRI